MKLVMFYWEFKKKSFRIKKNLYFLKLEKIYSAIIILILIVFIIMLVHYEELGRVYMSYDQKGHLSKLVSFAELDTLLKKLSKLSCEPLLKKLRLPSWDPFLNNWAEIKSEKAELAELSTLRKKLSDPQ